MYKKKHRKTRRTSPGRFDAVVKCGIVIFVYFYLYFLWLPLNPKRDDITIDFKGERIMSITTDGKVYDNRHVLLGEFKTDHQGLLFEQRKDKHKIDDFTIDNLDNNYEEEVHEKKLSI